MNFLDTLDAALEKGSIDSKLYHNLTTLHNTYAQSLEEGGIPYSEEHEAIFLKMFELVLDQVLHPPTFEPFHKKITAPINYFRFGIDFLRPLVDKEISKVLHINNVEKIDTQLARGENVILFANHQTEVDPQLMSLMLEKHSSEIAEEVIFVAGDRVISDPMAIPFSIGRNLLCIYSKRHIDSPPEKKNEKQLHNQRTMRRMKELLAEGGKCIYVAPSGGRDRPNAEGEVTVAPFDPQSIEMFRLMAKQSKCPTHFYPLALVTYDILPPPHTIETELGEVRNAKRGGIFFSFADEVDMDEFPGSDMQDRHAKRSARAMHIWNIVKTEYTEIKQGLAS